MTYDDPGCPLAASATTAWRSLFASGGRWMQQALARARGVSAPESKTAFNRLGFIKYGLAGGAAILVLLPSIWWEAWPLLILVVAVFYAVEAQMVFLFPLAIDGSQEPFRDSRRWTLKAGGTWAVMRVVIPIAALMIFGGFIGQGFVRSWCLGCLAICIWYEDLRERHFPDARDDGSSNCGSKSKRDSSATRSCSRLTE